MYNTITIQDIPVHYKVTGEGPHLLLLHGWGCDLEIFKPIQDHLSQRYTTYSIDFPGFGKTPDPPQPWSTEEYAALTEEFIQKLNLENPILLGHSFGGRVSIRLSAKHPIPKVILTGGAGLKPKRKLDYYIKVYSYKTVKNVLKLPGLRNYSEQILEKYRKKSGSSDYQKASGIMRQTLVKVVNEDLRYLLPSIKASTLLIWGENDTATPLSDAHVMEKEIPDAGLAVLKNAGHYGFLEKQAEFLIILDHFI
ncbi:alpha/beta hydrolase [marine bacterium AO1-C]|nr:alpha/beta hydrolase [marine bacterium AO1-C]